MPRSSGRQIITKPEQLEMLSTDKDTHFTGAIAMNVDEEDESISGLISNNIAIKGVNGQSIQNNKYRLKFWGSSVFSSTDLDQDTYVSDVVLDFSDTLSAHRRKNTGQYYLDVDGLDIPLNTSGQILYCSLQNMSPVAKIAGAGGYVQFDIKYAPRL